jgi:alkylated DNA repair protein alkB family protein 6
MSESPEIESEAATREIEEEAPGTITHRILCEPRSLLVTLAPAYSTTMHRVPDVTHDTDLRHATVANWDLLGQPERYAGGVDGGRTSDVGGDVGEGVEVGGTNVRTTRVSLTYRDVLKVSSAASRVLGFGGRR